MFSSDFIAEYSTQIIFVIVVLGILWYTKYMTTDVEGWSSSPGALIQLATSSPYTTGFGYPNYISAGGLYKGPVMYPYPSYPIYRYRQPWYPQVVY